MGKAGPVLQLEGPSKQGESGGLSAPGSCWENCSVPCSHVEAVNGVFLDQEHHGISPLSYSTQSHAYPAKAAGP